MEVATWRRWAVVACAVVCVAACGQNQSSPAGRRDSPTSAPVPRASRVGPLVSRLASTDKKVVDEARRDLMQKWEDAGAPSPAEAIQLLRASTTRFPLDSPGYDIATEIMLVVTQVPRSEYVPVIGEVFPRLSPHAREAALVVLSVIDDASAAETFVRLLRENAGQLSKRFTLNRLRKNPHHGAVLVPGLLDLAKHDAIADEMYLTALEFCRLGEVTPDRLAAQAPPLLAAYRRERAWLLPRQQPRGLGWMWTDAYQSHRRRAGILLDLAGCLPERDVSAE